jgi:hypothetical protein
MRLTEVATAQVNAGVHILGQLRNYVVVTTDVRIEKVINSADVVLVLSPAVSELGRAEVYIPSARIKSDSSIDNLQAMLGSSN